MQGETEKNLIDPPLTPPLEREGKNTNSRANLLPSLFQGGEKYSASATVLPSLAKGGAGGGSKSWARM